VVDKLYVKLLPPKKPKIILQVAGDPKDKEDEAQKKKIYCPTKEREGTLPPLAAKELCVVCGRIRGSGENECNFSPSDETSRDEDELPPGSVFI